MLAVVCDASPLVYLARLEQVGLLRLLYEAVLVPPAVWQEVAVGGLGLPESAHLRSAVEAGWIRVEAPARVEERLSEFPRQLGRGEAEAIALAQERMAVLLTDDRLGRKLAEALGLEVTGTIGLLIRAKRLGHLTRVEPLIARLRQETNFRMSEALWLDLLHAAGEPPGASTN